MYGETIGIKFDPTWRTADFSFDVTANSKMSSMRSTFIVFSFSHFPNCVHCMQDTFSLGPRDSHASALIWATGACARIMPACAALIFASFSSDGASVQENFTRRSALMVPNEDNRP
jgi:hypothetical protein